MMLKKRLTHLDYFFMLLNAFLMLFISGNKIHNSKNITNLITAPYQAVSGFPIF